MYKIVGLKIVKILEKWSHGKIIVEIVSLPRECPFTEENFLHVPSFLVLEIRAVRD